jgi:hypothetical protein
MRRGPLGDRVRVRSLVPSGRFWSQNLVRFDSALQQRFGRLGGLIFVVDGWS